MVLLRGLAIGVDFLGVYSYRNSSRLNRHRSATARAAAIAVGPAREQTLHFGGGFQVPLGIGMEQVPGGPRR